MNAGRELDALVAEKVMGCRWVPIPPRLEALYGTEGIAYATRETVGGRVSPEDGCPHYSTDIAAAWTVIDALMAGDWFQVNVGCNHESGWWVRLDHGAVEADGKTAPEAICTAALRAVGALP